MIESPTDLGLVTISGNGVSSRSDNHVATAWGRVPIDPDEDDEEAVDEPVVIGGEG